MQGARRAGGAAAGVRRGDPAPAPAALLRLLVGHRGPAARPVDVPAPSWPPCRGGQVDARGPTRRPTGRPTRCRRRRRCRGRPTRSAPAGRWSRRPRRWSAAAGEPVADDGSLFADEDRSPRLAAGGRAAARRAGAAAAPRGADGGAARPPVGLPAGRAAPRPGRAGPPAAPAAAAPAGAAGPPRHRVPPLAGGALRRRAAARRRRAARRGRRGRRAGRRAGALQERSWPASGPTARRTRWRCRSRPWSAGVVVRGRMDAVFADPDGRLDVVDWKTGRRRRRRRRGGRGAAGRLPAGLGPAGRRPGRAGPGRVPLRAAGPYGRPADLLDAAGLAALVDSIPTGPD